MLVFWEHGYEGASLATLTQAMGISTTSMYAAFGNKEELFRKALERYTEGPGGYLARALKEPTAREVATAILAGTVRTTTRPPVPILRRAARRRTVSPGPRPAPGGARAPGGRSRSWRRAGCCRRRRCPEAPGRWSPGSRRPPSRSSSGTRRP